MLHYPKSREEWLALRHQYVSSTEVSALFGMSAYKTAFELAVIKKGETPDDSEANERMRWGTRLQHSIARGIGEDYGVKVRAITGYATDGFLAAKMGASFDYEIVGLLDGEFTGNTALRDMYTRLGAGVLEIKNVDTFIFKAWKVDEGLEPPAHIELQVQHQLACIARSWAAIGVLVGGNQLELLIRERDNEVAGALRKKCIEFWTNLDKGIMPPVELPADVGIISKLYGFAEPGKVLDAQADDEVGRICAAYADATAAEKAAKDAKDTAKAQLLMKIGDAEKVIAKGYKVSAGVVSEAEIPAYTRKGYRNIRVTKLKESVDGR